MYTPKVFADGDPAALPQIVADNAFGLLVTVDEKGPVATHVPFVLSDDGQSLLCHVAKANPQWRGLEAGRPALAVFTGLHAYISPSWYASEPAVPTWNYSAVHVSGPARAITDTERLHALVDKLTRRYESARPVPWSLESVPQAFLNRQLAGIVGVEIRIERVEGKRKLSQNRSASDRAGVVEGLAAENDAGAHAVAVAMTHL